MHSHTPHRASLFFFIFFFLWSIRRGTSLRESCAHRHNSDQSSYHSFVKKGIQDQEGKPRGLCRTLQDADKQLQKQNHLHIWMETGTLQSGPSGDVSLTKQRGQGKPQPLSSSVQHLILARTKAACSKPSGPSHTPRVQVQAPITFLICVTCVAAAALGFCPTSLRKLAQRASSFFFSSSSLFLSTCSALSTSSSFCSSPFCWAFSSSFSSGSSKRPPFFLFLKADAKKEEKKCICSCCNTIPELNCKLGWSKTVFLLRHPIWEVVSTSGVYVFY